jgi:hypothetical protein
MVEMVVVDVNLTMYTFQGRREGSVVSGECGPEEVETTAISIEHEST